MNKSIKVNEASIIDLKAELFKKEENFKQKQSLQSSGNVNIEQQAKGSKTLDKLALITGKKKIAPKRNASSEQTTTVKSSQDDEEFKKAKLRLQSKAEIYEKLKRGELEDVEEDGGESLYLVDFLKKPMSDDCDVSEEEWVEFEDSLGRQRRCLRRDFEKLKDADPLFRPVEKNSALSSMQLEEAHRQMMKEKWDQEQQTMNQNPQRDIHYQNIKFDEVRELGVGYYQFSKEQSERKTQMESLNKLREQTIEQRANREKIKTKRQAVLAARLAKVREKKLKKQLPQDINEHPIAENKEETILVENIKDSATSHQSKTEEENKQTTVADESISTSDHLRSAAGSSTGLSTAFPAPKLTSACWIETQREERIPEFAPPSIYDQPQPKKESRHYKKIQ